jgi:CheY-like chemotaxis protein
MHECDEAEDGKFAVEMVKTAAEKNRPYDLVLMDYEMPVMDGPTAASKIRSFGSDVFIIGVTGNMMAEDVDHFCECGANVVLPKPFKMASLEDICVEYNIGRREV